MRTQTTNAADFSDYQPYSPSIERHAYSARIDNYQVHVYLSSGHPAADIAILQEVFQGRSEFNIRADHLRGVATALQEAADAIDRARSRPVGAVRDDNPPQPPAAAPRAATWREAAAIDWRAEVGPRDILIGPNNKPTTDESAAVGWFDSQHGNTWLASSTKRYSHAQAADYIASLNAEAKLGYTDWRLPPIEELEPQRDLARFPAIRPGLNKLIKAEWHWSSSPVPESAGYARVVSFGYGVSYVYNRVIGFHVLACRGGVGAVGGVSPGQ